MSLENDQIQWHLRKNPSDKLKDIITIGIYVGHAFLIETSMDWHELMYAVTVKHASHKLATFNDTLKHVHKEKQLSIVQTSASKFCRHLMREFSTTTTKPKLQPHRTAGFSSNV